MNADFICSFAEGKYDQFLMIGVLNRSSAGPVRVRYTELRGICSSAKHFALPD